MFKIGKGKPVVDPYGLLEKKILSSRVLLLFTPRLFKVAARMLQGGGEVRFSGLLFRSFEASITVRRFS